MKRLLGVVAPVLAFALALGACAQKSAYEAAVEDMEPVYCYRSLGGVQCYETPHFRDERRLVNYFGPAPKRHDRPAPAPEPKLFAPQPITRWVKDPEPAPMPAPKGDLADRPWLGAAPVISEAELDALRGRPAASRPADAGAFVKRIGDALDALARKPAAAPPQGRP